ncbi:MAG: hypothetical protein Q9M92_15540 [Enterobacterales bacterium]|nr:hypothetical protein [Enterobacterales bacterium]
MISYLKTNYKIPKWLSFSFIGYLLLVLIFKLVNTYVDDQLAKKSDASLYQSCYKIWATRGLVTVGDRSLTSSGNSIKTIQLAFKHGTKGSEIDLFYDVKMDRFILSHNFPYRLKDGKLLSLQELISNIGNDYYLWLDLKKLGRLSKPQAQAAAARLLKITEGQSIRNKIYIEGEDPINLAAFRDAQFHTIFDTQPLKGSYWLSDFVMTLYKMIFYFNDFSVMAMNSGAIDDPIFDQDAEIILSNVPLFLYHIPDNIALLQKYSDMKNVKVMLNTDHSADRFQLNSCQNLSHD